MKLLKIKCSSCQQVSNTVLYFIEEAIEKNKKYLFKTQTNTKTPYYFIYLLLNKGDVQK